ncbi:hypothetical protein A0H76_1004 [Hepatospora eriocheir]|uniref:Integrase catalytic domain-containing protein n=1 Tax=Hepatospora eriocheir TaxID=1081669 RepID=A0A1X0QI55_9MICR|nr:hypothetical protein A0H76_1004 [Hepatospora eriocheir]
MNIKLKFITTYNPSSNGICDRVHSTLGNIIRIRRSEKLDVLLSEAADMLRSTFHSGVGMSPMKLVFSREKFTIIDNVLKGNKNLTKSIENSAKQAEKNKEEINKNRIDIKYNFGDLILIINENCSKLDERFRGPFEVLEVYENSLKV